MPRVRDVLHRFSPVGAPGAASSAGVPVDRTADLAAELAPVLALLADTERQCREIVAAAEREAAAVRAGAEQRARAAVAAARAQVDQERAAVVSRALQQQSTERAQALAAAEREAGELRRRAAGQLRGHVLQVVAAVSALLDDVEPAAGTP